MTDIADWVDVARTRRVWDIGQLTPADKRRLDRAAKQGTIEKGFGHWMSLGPRRAFWQPRTAASCLSISEE